MGQLQLHVIILPDLVLRDCNVGSSLTVIQQVAILYYRHYSCLPESLVPCH